MPSANARPADVMTAARATAQFDVPGVVHVKR
jgi:hypothetical protein